MKQTLACLPVCPATAQPASATTSLVTPGRRAALSGLARAALGALSALALSASTFLPLPATAHAAVSLSLQAPAPLMESSFEAEVVDLVNQDRLAYGLAPIAFDPALLPAARQRATDQVPQPVLNHYDPLGQLVFVKLLARDGVSYLLAGENLARLAGLDDDTAPRAERALLRSPTHRANILEPTYNRIAVGATMDDQGNVIFAQLFRAG